MDALFIFWERKEVEVLSSSLLRTFSFRIVSEEPIRLFERLIYEDAIGLHFLLVEAILERKVYLSFRS